MFCRQCGRSLAPNARFCGNCGTRVTSDAIETSKHTARVSVPQNTSPRQPNVSSAEYSPNYQSANHSRSQHASINDARSAPGYAQTGVAFQSLQQVYHDMRTAAVIWLVVGILQIIVGLNNILIFGDAWGIFTIIIGVVNIANSANDRKFLETQNPGWEDLQEHFKSQNGFTASLVYNLVLGILLLFGDTLSIILAVVVFVALILEWNVRHKVEDAVKSTYRQ